MDHSITETAGAGFRLSLLLNAAACQIAQAGIEIHSIAKGISLFSLMLKQVGQALRPSESQRCCTTPDAVNKASEIARQGQSVFSDIEQMLDKLRSTDENDKLKTIPLPQRVKWCFRKQHVTYLLAQLESLKLSLSVMYLTLHVGKLISLEQSNESTPEMIAQEKAEAQNMIIVRHWSNKRLERLWEAVEMESREAENDQTNRQINEHYGRSCMPITSTSHGKWIRLPVVSLAESDAKMGDMEKSPKDMVQFSAAVLDKLVALWTYPTDHGELVKFDGRGTNGTHRVNWPQPHLSSGSSDEDEFLGSDGTQTRGFYLEGNTEDWRRPHSQQARAHAAKLRKHYAKYQSHVDSDSDRAGEARRRRRRQKKPEDDFDGTSGSDGRLSDDPRTSRKSRQSDSHASDSTDFERNSNGGHSLRNKEGMGPAVPQRNGPDLKTSPTSQSRPSLYPQARASYTAIPRPPQQQQQQQQWGPQEVPGPMPPNHGGFPSSAPSYGSPKVHFEPAMGGAPPQQPPSQASGRYPNQANLTPHMYTNPANYGYPPLQRSGSLSPTDPQQQQQRGPQQAFPIPINTSSVSSSGHRPNQHHHQHRHYHRSPSRNKPHQQQYQTRDEAKERHEAFKKNATRGLLGIGAIAGFMDALEAFSMI